MSIRAPIAPLTLPARKDPPVITLSMIIILVVIISNPLSKRYTIQAIVHSNNPVMNNNKLSFIYSS